MLCAYDYMLSHQACGRFLHVASVVNGQTAGTIMRPLDVWVQQRHEIKEMHLTRQLRHLKGMK